MDTLIAVTFLVLLAVVFEVRAWKKDAPLRENKAAIQEMKRVLDTGAKGA